MREEWIQGRFEGVYTGERRPDDASDPPGARRFGFEIESGWWSIGIFLCVENETLREVRDVVGLLLGKLEVGFAE